MTWRWTDTFGPLACFYLSRLPRPTPSPRVSSCFFLELVAHFAQLPVSRLTCITAAIRLFCCSSLQMGNPSLTSRLQTALAPSLQRLLSKATSQAIVSRSAPSPPRTPQAFPTHLSGLSAIGRATLIWSTSESPTILSARQPDSWPPRRRDYLLIICYCNYLNLRVAFVLPASYTGFHCGDASACTRAFLLGAWSLPFLCLVSLVAVSRATVQALTPSVEPPTRLGNRPLAPRSFVSPATPHG